MLDINPIMSIITGDVNKINAPNEREGLSE